MHPLDGNNAFIPAKQLHPINILHTMNWPILRDEEADALRMLLIDVRQKRFATSVCT